MCALAAIPGVELVNHRAGGVVRLVQLVQCWFCRVGALRITVNGQAFPQSAVFKHAKARGWEMDRRGKHKCPECLEKEKVVTKVRTGASDQAPRQMDPQDRRKVFRAIDESYDEVNRRYVAGYSDERIAKDLAIPRKWVETIREESFGPAGIDPELARLAGEIERIDAELKKAGNAYFEVMAGAEKRIAEARAKLAVMTGQRMT